MIQYYQLVPEVPSVVGGRPVKQPEAGKDASSGPSIGPSISFLRGNSAAEFLKFSSHEHDVTFSTTGNPCHDDESFLPGRHLWCQ